MSAPLKSVRVFGCTYAFIDPVVIDKHIFPLLAVLEKLHPYFRRFETDNDVSLANRYKHQLFQLYKPTRRIYIIEVIDLLKFHHKYIHSTDKSKCLEFRTYDFNFTHCKRNIIIDVLTEDPNLDIYTFIREVNLRLNNNADDRILQREDGTYYIDSSWEDVSDEFINEIIDSYEDICYMYGRTFDPTTAKYIYSPERIYTLK